MLGTVQLTLIAAITVITVALPAIRRDLRLDDGGAVLVSSAYGLAFGGLLLLGGRLADSFGRRRVFVTGAAVFGLGSAAAGLAPGAGAMVAARFVQGAGAALAAPAAMALCGTLFPDPRRRSRAMAVWGVLSSAGATAGTVLSGVVITWVPWRWVFLAPVLVSAAAVATATALFPADRPAGTRRIDWPGAILATTGLAAAIYGLQRSGWAVAAGVLLLASFCLAERRSPAPLTHLPFLARRALPLAAVTLCAAAMATAFFILSLHLQQARGLSPLRTSAVFLLSAPPLLAAGPLTGRLVARLGARRVLAAGSATAATGLGLLSLLGAPYAGLLVFPLGAGTTFSAALLATLHGVRDDEAGLAGGLVNTAMEVGPPLGLAVLIPLAAAHSPDPSSGYGFALRVAAVALAITAVCAALPRRTR
ncbi:MFS transporter [Actinoallomurus spadix]|uniref:DHA2 family efflux MFS transporter permease subunit n=1 Tax=Actinoallomurus spadix TaxID=79912 RepID=A0ABP3GWJ8_9ACTN|nr:MFS transporter [Actinoallomurus spadix]MCO5986047.1 MFS transporter [Actinoallomurus spadix]